MSGISSPDGPLPLIGDKRFGPLFWTQALGAFNDNFYKSAIILLFTFGAASSSIPLKQLVPLAGAVFILPFFLFSGWSGVLSDKYEKARVLQTSKALEIAAMALGALGFALKNDVMLLAVLFITGTQSTLFGPAKYSIVPQLVAPEKLVGATAAIELGTFLAILLGTMAGVIVVWPNGTVLVSVGTVLVALVGYVASRGIPPVGRSAPELRLPWEPFTPTAGILKQVAGQRGIMNSILAISWFWFFGATYLTLFPTFTRSVLCGNENVATLLLATFSVGIGVGSTVCGRLSRGMLELGLVPIGTVGMTLFTIDLALLDIPWTATAAEASLGIGDILAEPAGRRALFDLSMTALFGGFFIVPLYALVQQRSNPEHGARIIAANNIMNALFMVVGALAAAGMLAAGLSIPMLFAVAAVCNAAVALFIYGLVPEFLLRFIVWMLIHLVYRLRVREFDAIPENGPALIVCNHVSFVDALVIMAACKRPIRFVMGHRIFRWPLLKFAFRTSRAIPIAPAKEDPAMMEQAFAEVGRALDAGDLVGIFPEGKITADGEISPFRSGMSRILARNPVPVVPLALRGLWGSFFSRKNGPAMTRPFPRGVFSKIELVMGAAIPAAEATPERTQAVVAGMRGDCV